MIQYVVEGGQKLQGECTVQGAKNSVLPILSAALLCSSGTVELHNCPALFDVDAACMILEKLGCCVEREADAITVDATMADGRSIPQYLMQTMRSSIVFLGPMLARYGQAQLCYPGGCSLGERPIDMHLAALRKMGAEICEDGGCIQCFCPDGLKGQCIYLPFPSVGATENIMMAATLAKGTTVLHNAAREPEIQDLADLLIRMGAKIEGAGGGIITIEGVSALHGAKKKIMPDRIVALTYMTAALATDGMVTLHGISAEYIRAALRVLVGAGASITEYTDSITVKRQGAFILPVRTIQTMPYPGFPTDAQALMMALLSRAAGTSVFVETIFPARYRIVGELVRMGAQITVEGRSAVVNGVAKLSAGKVRATDLRGGAALIIAALSAEGQTTILQGEHICRGYEHIEEVLRSMGAIICKESEKGGV